MLLLLKCRDERSEFYGSKEGIGEILTTLSIADWKKFPLPSGERIKVRGRLENRKSIMENGTRKPNLITILSIAGCRFRIVETKNKKQ